MMAAWTRETLTGFRAVATPTPLAAVKGGLAILAWLAANAIAPLLVFQSLITLAGYAGMAVLVIGVWPLVVGPGDYALTRAAQLILTIAGGRHG